MKIYRVEIDLSARLDIADLYSFLISVKSQSGANKYIDAMVAELQSLSVFADLYQTSRMADIKRYHPHARSMASHNKRWTYIFHVEEDTVVVDRIRPSKLVKS